MRHSGFFPGLFFDPEYGAIYSSETSADFQPTTRRYIPEGRTLWNNSYYGLMSCNGLYLREYA
jgi:hypothetical protein